MRFFCIALCLSWMLFACNEEEGSSSQYIIVNKVNGQGNISVYEYPSGNVTESLYTVNSQVTAAAKDRNHVYLHTGYAEAKLRKVELSDGKQVKETNTWIFYKPFMEIHDSNLILSYAEQVGSNQFRSYVKIYDENLNRIDSITDENVAEVRSMKVANNKLFSVVLDANTGFLIRVLDLKTRTYIASIPVSFCHQLVYMNENKLMVILSGNYFILDTESLQASAPKTSYFQNNPVAYDSPNNILYVLNPNAQPSLVQYTLYKFDLSSSEMTPLSEYGESIVGPVVYDQKNKVIVSGGSLKFFSTNGKVLKTAGLSSPISHIFIR